MKKLVYNFSYNISDEKLRKNIRELALQIESNYNLQQNKNKTYIFFTQKNFSFVKNSGAPQITMQLKDGNCEITFVLRKPVVIFLRVLTLFALLMEIALLLQLMQSGTGMTEWWYLLLPIGITLFGRLLCSVSFHISSLILLKKIKRYIH